MMPGESFPYRTIGSSCFLSVLVLWVGIGCFDFVLCLWDVKPFCFLASSCPQFSVVKIGGHRWASCFTLSVGAHIPTSLALPEGLDLGAFFAPDSSRTIGRVRLDCLCLLLAFP